jgi:hypothetical protein
MREAFYVFHFERYSRNVELAEFFKSIFRNKFNFPKPNIFFFHIFLLFFVLYVCVGKQNVNKNGGVGRVRGYRGRCLFAKKNFELETFFLMLKSEI